MLIKLEHKPRLYNEVTKILKQGGIVVLPTDTIYGFAVDGTNVRAVERLREVKGRGQKPFTFFLSRNRIAEYARIVKRKIIEYFIPGPLTVILKKHPEKSLPFVEDKIGLRIPHTDFVIQLLSRYEAPLAVTSANYSGDSPIISASEIAERFPEVELVLDGGALSSRPSTVIDLTATPPVVKRKGVIPVLEIEKVHGGIVQLAEGLKFNVLFVCSGNTCRSPMAEALLKTMVSEEYCTVRSAGILPTQGMPASQYSREVVEEFGGSLEKHRSRQITDSLIEWADIIFVMGYKHYDHILDISPSAAVKTFLLKEYKRRVKYNEISDPVGRDRSAYEAAARDMLPSLKLIARDIKRRFRSI